MEERGEVGRIITITYKGSQGGLPEIQGFWNELQARKPSLIFRALQQGDTSTWPSCHTSFYDKDKATVVSLLEYSPRDPGWVLQSYKGEKTWQETVGSIEVVAPGKVCQFFGGYRGKNIFDNLNTIDTGVAEYVKAVKEFPNDGKTSLHFLTRDKFQGQKGLVVTHREEQFLIIRFPEKQYLDTVVEHLGSYNPIDIGQEFPFLREVGLGGFFGDSESS